MTTTKTTLWISALLTTAALVGCNGATFSGATPSRATDSPSAPAPSPAAPTPSSPTGSATPTPTPAPGSPSNPAAPSAPSPAPATAGPITPAAPAGPASPSSPSGTTTTTTTKQCSPGQTASVGAQIALLIDNSNSNALTDCPSAKQSGTFRNVNIYSCGAQTNREAAVLAAYDVLQQVSASQPSNAAAVSSLAIASFPTQADYVSGWTQQSQGWVTVNGTTRASVANAMLFARQPFGMTPYGAAMSAATDLFQSSANDAREKVAILITDGNATDRNPATVAAQAASLRAAGVTVISLVYSTQDAAAENADIAMMQTIDQQYVAQGSGHWYTANYANFDAYIAALIGTNGLMQTVSNHDVVEVSDSTGLKAALMSVIQTKAVSCTD